MSTRFAPVVIVLLALALIPTVIHSYVGIRVNDGLKAAAIPGALAGEVGAPTARRPVWVKSRFDSDDWIERRYTGRGDATVFVVRSLDAKRLYHHPELAIAYGDSYGAAKVVHLSQRPEVPVYLLPGVDSNQHGRAMYVLLYDGRYVANPIAFQLRTSFNLLFTRPKPMTLFFVRERLVATDAPPDRSRGAELLLAAIDGFAVQQSAHPR